MNAEATARLEECRKRPKIDYQAERLERELAEVRAEIARLHSLGKVAGLEQQIRTAHAAGVQVGREQERQRIIAWLTDRHRYEATTIRKAEQDAILAWLIAPPAETKA